MMYPDIDWSVIADAMSYYSNIGYTKIEVPWIVPSVISGLTCPVGRDFLVETGYSLVGSAEQGFMDMRSRGELHPGKYVSCSPCFRREDVVDEFHQLYFMKVELYAFGDTTVQDVIDDASGFLGDVDKVQTIDGIDLYLNGIEVGSYGERKTPLCGDWVYGTGVAEPRFSIARSR